MKIKYGLLLVPMALMSHQALAASITDTFQVSATVTATCQNLTSTDLTFGTYDPFSGSDTSSTSTISVTCTNGASYSISLNSGNSGSFTNRTLASGANNINYNLYSDSGFSTVWGDGTGGSSSVSGTGTGSSTSVTVYGRILAGQNVPAGSYTDTITVTVDY